MGNKLRDIFNPDSKIAEREIKRIINQAYDRQDCATCVNHYFDINTNVDFEVPLKCSVSQRLVDERQWSRVDNSEQYCLFYKEEKK